MKIGILQAGRPPKELVATHGDYAQMFMRLLAGHGFTFETFEVEYGVFPPSIHAADGWLITGSRHGVYEPHPWIPPLEDFIRACFEEDVPMIGVCFGHQIMAQALGGKAVKFDGGWTVGKAEYAFDNGEMQKLMAWHQDQVVEPPPNTVCIASSDSCRYAALLYGRTGLSLQPHPEFDEPFMRDLLEARSDVLPSEVSETAERSLGGELSASRTAQLMAEFFKTRRVPMT